MTDRPVAVRDTRAGVVSVLRSAFERASQSITATLTAAVVPELEPELSDAVDRGVTVVLLLYDTDPAGDWAVDYDFGDIATVVRAVPRLQPVVGQVDYRVGFYGDGHLLSDDHGRSGPGFALVRVPQIALGMVASFQSLDWRPAEEVYVVDRDPLPATYTNHEAWTIQGTLALRDGDRPDVVASVQSVRGIDDRGRFELRGRLVDVRQGLVYPETDEFPGENALVVESDEGHCSLGGPAAYKEAYQAEKVTFE
jgi:hypothetical protein